MYGRLGLSRGTTQLGNMFAVHLVAFYFTKLKEDQIKKVRTLQLRCPAPVDTDRPNRFPLNSRRD